MGETHLVLGNIVDEATESITRLINEAYALGLEDGKKNKDKDTKPEIEIGAIVRGGFCNGVVTKIDNAYDEVCVLWHDGEVSTETFEWVKRYLTGRKIKGLNGVLDEIKEVND